MRLLVISSLWPHSGHTVRAANVVIYELVRALAQHGSGTIGYLRVRRYGDPPQTEAEGVAAARLRALGVEVLEEQCLPAPPKKRSAWRKLFAPCRSDFYPESIFASLISVAIAAFRPDVLLIPWSEWVTALCADLSVAKFAYYGNPDHKAGRHRAAFDRRYGLSQYSWLRGTLYLRRLEQAHLEIMRHYEMVGDVAANDAQYYQAQGHPNAFYVHNVWIDRLELEWKSLRAQHEQRMPVKIIANVGQLGATANRYGLEMLGAEVGPALRRMLHDIPYELHILGNGELIAPLAQLLDSPEIHVRGFVDDIDRELLESQAFLCLNNGGPFKVGHTRYLHAWSLGCCVVAHRHAALSMPELQHRKTAMLGENAEEIAGLIREVLMNQGLRMEIGLGGYEAFRAHFVADRVAEELWQQIYAWRRRSAGEMPMSQSK